MKTPVLPLLHAAALLCAPALAATASAQAPPPAANSTGAEPQPNKASQPDLRTLLRDALFEEEATRDLTKAAAGYEALLAAWNEQRPTAAAALYRLAEVRRKQDRKDDAIALYQRLLREFPDIEPHARLARENLTALGAKEPAPGPPLTPAEALKAGVWPDDKYTFASQDEAVAHSRIKKLAVESPDLLRGHEYRDACEKGWLSVVQVILSQNIPLDLEGFTAAAGKGHLAIVREILKQKPNPEALGAALSEAASQNRIAVLKLLLESGASSDGGSAEHSALTSAINSRSNEAAELLLTFKANPDPATAATSPLFAAAMMDNEGMIGRLLPLKVDPNRPTVRKGDFGSDYSTSPGGSTPLHAAVLKCNVNAARLLLDAKANPNAVNEAGWTPLMGAITLNHLPLVEQLLAAGADPNLAGKDNQTPLLISVWNQQRPIAAALLKAKASPNALVGPEKNRTAMSYCFDIKDEAELEAWVNLFLEHGANPVWPDAPAINYAPPAWKLKLCRSQVYPMMALTPSIVLIFPEENQLNWLAHRKDENEKPGTLPALLTVWHEKGGWEIPDGGRFATLPDWSTLRLWRKGADGKMQETVLPVKKETKWPELQWGDVVEVLAAEKKPNASGRTGFITIPKGLPPETLDLLKSAK